MDGAAKAFAAISLFDEHRLNKLNSDELRPLLPCLTRMAFCPSLDCSDKWANQKKKTLQLISHLEEVNLIVSLLSVDFQVIENEWKRNGRQKMSESIVLSVSNHLLVELESANPGKKLLLFMHELQQLQQRLSSIGGLSSLQRPITSELFDHDIYMDAMSDMACVLLAELPHSFLMNDLIDTLLAVKSGPLLICRLALNFPHAFNDICSHLLDKEENEPEHVFAVERRIQVLRALCRLNPSHSLLVRAQALAAGRLPALCVYLTIDHMKITARLSSPDSDEAMEIVSASNAMPQECNQLVSFISGVLLGDDERRRQWFVAYIRCGQKKAAFEVASSSPSVLLLRKQLHDHCLRLCQLLRERSNNESFSVLIEASSLLKLYCAFRGLCTLKLFDHEITAIVDLITIRPPPNPPGIRFASIGLCMLLAAPSLSASPDTEKQVLHWLQDIVSEPKLFGHVSSNRSSFCEMLLLIAIHFHSNQSSAIGDLISTVLGIKIPVRQNNLIKMKSIFTQEIFPDHAVTAHAIKVPVTHRLNSQIPGFLPVHCIYQLLKSRAFTKHKVPIKDWIFKQICSSCAPLNPVLPSLIETYVQSILVPSSKNSPTYVNEPIAESELSAIFDHKIYSVDLDLTVSDQMEMSSLSVSADEPVCWLTTQLLFLYYLLWYEETRLAQSKNILNLDRSAKKYSSELLAKIPVYFLLQEARKDANKYGLFFPALLRLVSTYYPHFCLVTDWLYTINHKRSLSSSQSLPSAVRLNKLKHSLQHGFACIRSQPALLMQAFDRLLNLPDNCVWPFARLFIDHLHLLLPASTPTTLLDRAKQVWLRMNSVFPDEFQVMTVNAIALNTFTFKPFTWKDIVGDPLQVLRCDRRVFHCPQLIEILLQMLQSFLIASRTFFVHHLIETQSKLPEEEKERDELRFALLQSQESAAIQILLEACRPLPDQAQPINEAPNLKNGLYLQNHTSTSAEREDALATHLKEEEQEDANLAEQRLAEVQRLICVHLHQVFIADPNLAKLVHFQGYDSKLLSLVVSKVPSMHICLDFIPELLSQPDLNKQIFSIQLCSYLCEHYAIPKSLSIARLCFNVANTLLGILSSEKRALFFVPVLPSLVRMCKPFPPLYEDAINLLIQISQICLSQLAAKSATFIAPNCSLSASTNVEDIDWPRARRFFMALPTNDLLAQTIRESFTSLINIKPVQALIKSN